jgi:carbonic anhydrase/acetyltransferase-like protein (isoleucine patch superfamily)
MTADARLRESAIDAGCFVARNATVIGDVTMGEGSSIWFGAVVRGDINAIRIGRRSNIQDLSCLHVDAAFGLTVGDDVTVGHRAILHGCRLGDRVLIGMGAIVLNGAAIGDESIIGAGALVTEGARVPPRSLVLGVPGKVVRTLAPADVEKILESADHYAKGAQLYRTTSWQCTTAGAAKG